MNTTPVEKAQSSEKVAHWVERIIVLVSDCIRLRFTGILEIRISFRDGGLRTVHAERKESVPLR